MRTGSCLAAVAAVLALAALASSAEPKQAGKKPEAEKLPSLEEGWSDVRSLAPALVDKVRTELLAGKDPKTPSFQFQGANYQARTDKSEAYGQVMSRFYFDGVIPSKKIEDIVAAVDGAAKRAAEFRGKNGPLLADAEKVERGAKAVWKGLVADPQAAEKVKAAAFEGKGKDELSFALARLSETAAAGKNDEAAAWAGEAYGAAARLADILRWIDLQTEWCADLATVFKSFDCCFENSSKELDKLGGWKNFMFGRCPGAESLQEIWTGEALNAEHLLCDFCTVSDADSAAMGKLDAKAEYFAVTPGRRGAYEKVLEKTTKATRPVFLAIPATKYETSAFNANIWRYEEEKKMDELIESLARHAAVCPKPTVTTMMEVIHIAQGAYGATDSATDRYHSQIREWALKLKGTADAAAAEAHKLVYGFYTAGGKPNYKGAIWTTTDAIKAGALDCIRASQMIGSVYACAGYWGMRPVRIGRGSVAQKMVACSGHTFVCLDMGAQDFCLDGLVKGAQLKAYAKMHAGDKQILSCCRGYRGLTGFVAGEIYFPQGPLQPVQLRMPHYGLARKGFK